MKKHFLFIIIIVFLFSTQFLTGEGLKLLKIEESGDREKLLFNLTDVEAIVADFDTGDLMVYIEFADMQDKVVARLGRIKKGKIKWGHKVESKEKMLVSFSNPDFMPLLENLRKNPMKPGYQVILSNSKTNEVLKSFEISAAPSADLSIVAKYPVKVQPGEELKGKITGKITNIGTAPAGNFHIGFSILSENQPPVKLGAVLKTFSKDVIIKNGQEEPRKFNPGESFDLSIENSIKVPDDMPPGRYQFEAKVDSEEKILESDEENNSFKGFLIVTVAEPKRLVLELTQTKLVFKPENFGFQLTHNNTFLSDGKDWRKCRIKAHVYQLRHATWKDFHWEIDTVDRSVWRVTGAEFCKTGGKAKEIKMKVFVRGGSKTTMPSLVELTMPNTWIEFEPATRKFNVKSYGDQIAYIPFWQTCKLESHLYQFKHVEWKDLYWQVDTYNKNVKQISQGKFCRAGTGADESPLKINLKVEK